MKNMKISSSSPPHFVFLEGYPHLFTCSIVGYYVPISHWFVEVASYTMIFNIVHSIKHMCWKSTPPGLLNVFSIWNHSKHIMEFWVKITYNRIRGVINVMSSFADGSRKKMLFQIIPWTNTAHHKKYTKWWTNVEHVFNLKIQVIVKNCCKSATINHIFSPFVFCIMKMNIYWVAIT